MNKNYDRGVLFKTNIYFYLILLYYYVITNNIHIIIMTFRFFIELFLPIEMFNTANNIKINLYAFIKSINIRYFFIDFHVKNSAVD